jgi:hypothetical protein
VKKKILLALLALTLPFIRASFGYVLEQSAWTKNRTVLMHLSLPVTGGPFQDGFGSLSDSAEDALNIWNQYLVHMKFVVDRNSVLPPSNSDDNMSVQLASTVFGDPFGNRVLAVTLINSRGSITEQTDVVFNSAINFDSYRGPLQQQALDFHRIALHEFGHVVGLDHPDEATPKQNVAAIMNSIVSNIDSLQADDIAGAQSIYSSGPDFQNSNPAPNLVNISTRAFVGLGDSELIGGFIIQGSQPATVILRAIGNSLQAAGISNTLNDPVLELRNASGGLIASSDDWIDGANGFDGSAIASYHLDPSNSRESALMATLNPGNYTAVVHSYDNGDGDLTGTALVELYDLHTNGGRAANISTRGQVQTGNNVMIGGFIVGGNQSKQVIARALGPSLAAAGVASSLSDPFLELRDASGNVVSSNDNWGDGPDAASIQAKGFAPSQSLESALQATLNPGNYTAIVRGVNNGTGVALVEIYDLSPPPN